MVIIDKTVTPSQNKEIKITQSQSHSAKWTLGAKGNVCTLSDSGQETRITGRNLL